jgi:hypothetical protein
MLGKCANPTCATLFRKLGKGKLFAFEPAKIATSVDLMSDTRKTKPGRSPIFFWLCESCSLTFTLGLDAAGQLTLQRVLDGARVTIFDDRRSNQAG